MTEAKVPATLEAIITERIKPIIGEMLPDDVLTKHVQAMLHNFTTPRDHYTISPLGHLINAELQKRAAATIQKYLDENCKSMWGMDGNQPSEIVSEIIQKTAPALLSALFGGVVQNTVDRVNDQLRQIAQKSTF